MDPDTLTFYTIAGGLSAAFGLVTAILAYLRPGARILHWWSLAMLVLAAGFFVSGVGPLLPRWATVIGTNLTLIAAGAILHTGFRAYCERRPATLDRWGWSVAALTVPAFWYWGLVEPNGAMRSAAFSLAVALINVRTARLLARAARAGLGGWPGWAMAALFAILALWMSARCLVLLTAPPHPPALRGANPTQWVTVLGYIALVASMSVCAIWMEILAWRRPLAREDGSPPGPVDEARDRLLLAWGAFAILSLGVVGALGVAQVELSGIPIAGPREPMRWVLTIAALSLGFALFLTLLLTVEIRRRDEQDRFMSMLNHELKTPLSVIRLALGGGDLPPAIREPALRALSDLMAVVERSLQSDRLRHGRIRPAPVACRPGALLTELAAGCDAPERLELRIAPLPVCVTDPQLLGMILGNLLDNALKYGAPGTQVRIQALPDRQRGRPGIRIVVANPPGSAGCPDARQVFRKYYRGVGAQAKTGSGLGLHLARGLAGRLGGWLRYRPENGQVRFELWIPV